MHTNAVPLVVLMSLAIACSGKQAGSTTIVAPVAQMPVTADTGLNARLQRDLEGWRARSELVVTIRVIAPDTVRLNRGAQLGVQEIKLDARDSAGQPIEQFSPAFSVSDSAVISLRAGRFTARSPGRGAIIVGVTRPEPATGRRRMMEMARIPVIVRTGP